jgi:hypothetical protein
MLTETYPARQRTAGPVLWALTSGIAGLVANVLLVLFFLLGQPFGASGPLAEPGQDFMWLASANDVVIIVQFLTFIPVALALRRWLPPTRSMWITTAAAVGAMVVVAILQLLLVAGVLEFDVQVILVVAMFLVVYAWVITVSSTGHPLRTAARRVLSGGSGHSWGRSALPRGFVGPTRLRHTWRGHRGHRLVGPSSLAVGVGPQCI